MKNVTRLLTKLMLLFVSVMLLQGVGKAEIYVQIGTGTTLPYNIGFNGYYYKGRTQYLYTAAEMTGLQCGPITKLAFDFTAIAGGTLYGLKMSMKNTAAAALPATDFDQTGFTQVYLHDYTPAMGNQIFVLDTPFQWDGVSNVVVDICFDNSAWGAYTRINHTATATTDYCRYFMGDSGLGCGHVGAGTLNAKANIQMYQLSPGTIHGTITSHYSGLPLPGSIVNVGCMNATANGSGVYTMNVVAGTKSVTASNLPSYITQTKTTVLAEGGNNTVDFSLYPNPATLTGHVYSYASGLPIKGAKIVVNGNVGYSVEGGLYTVSVFPGGSFPATFKKAGFGDTTTTAITLTAGVTTTLNMNMQEATNPASPAFIAALNGGANAVNLSWNVPKGKYEIIYDDGIQELSTVWADAGNLNAVKFTPYAYPVTLDGGSVNIGLEADYASGTTPGSLHNFKIQAYDATGPGGTPGTPLGHAVTITPTSFGWNEFTLTDNITITSGNYYLVMTQLGTPPTAARLGVDTTATQLRSYSKFVSGSGAWLPANGNFMIRSVVYGVPAPTDNSQGVVGYQVYRLFQGQQGALPSTWQTFPGNTPTTTSCVDPTWPSLPDSAFMWAVKAHYTNNRWSPYIFSNVLGKNRTASVTVNVLLTCDSMPKAGSLVKLTCTVPTVDSVYTGLTDNFGTVTFPKVWKGVYTINVTRFAFITTNMTNVSIYSNRTIDVNLLFAKPRPTDMTVNPRSLQCTWNAPKMQIPILFDDFSSGTFTTNGWTVDSGSNWYVNTLAGNPAPDAFFDWYPELVNYDYSLYSKSLTGLGSSVLLLKYDIYGSMFYSDPALTMSVDINDGSGWVTLKSYDGTGNTSWTTETVDISAYTSKTFQIRFRSQGDDTMALWDWDVDNVAVLAVQSITQCLLGYNVYLNGVHDGMPTPVPTDTNYYIPGSHVVYGNTYHACVDALYGAGTSAQTCAEPPFTARWLCPPKDLTGVGTESTAYLTWSKPFCGGCIPTTYAFDDGTYEMNWWIGAGATGMLANVFTLAGTVSGTMTDAKVWFVTSTTPTPLTFRIYDGTHTNLLYETPPFTPTPDAWNTIPLANFPFTGTFYAAVSWVGNNTSATLGLDTDGSPNNAWGYYVPLGGWFSLYTWGGYTGSYMIRIDACVNGKAELLKPEPVAARTFPNVAGPVGNYNTSTAVGEPPAPSAPLANPILLGYNVYRNASPTPIAYLGNPNTLEYYDMNLDPGVYTYGVTGYYDVSPVAPGHDNSMPAGPVTVVINYGRPLPFYEPWDMGTFDFNVWKHQGNWSVNTGLGNPAPCADFAWQPPLTNYSDTLKTPPISAAPYTCAKIYLDYDYKLIDRNATSAEKLTVEEFVGGSYKKITEYVNNGNVNWMSEHFELKSTLGKAFRIQFRANGANSLDMLHWYVDNIHLYAVCTAPTALTYTQSHNTVNLSWTAPNCVQEQPFSIIYDDGSYENGIANPPGYTYSFGNMFVMTAGASGYLTSFDLFFYQSGASGPLNLTMDVYDATFNVIGSSAPFLQGNGAWQNVEVPSIPFTGTFYGMVNESGTPTRPNWLGYDDDGPYASLDYGMYYDGAGTWGTIGSLIGDQGVYMERANGFLYGKLDKPFSVMPGQNPATTKPTNGVKRNDLTAGAVKVDTYNHPGTGIILPRMATSAPLQGYNVYRTDSTAHASTFHKLNLTGPVNATTYTDIIPLTGLGFYKYYVTSIFNDTVANTFLCESPGSDTITVQFPHVGIVEIGNGQIMVYPNPANDNVNVKSDYVINSIEVMNYVGQTVYRNANVDGKNTHFNVSNLNAGIYFVKVTTEQGVRSVKITVTR
ncbi:MAG: T9SS type A sorting domain-containing protein [Bacteroidetes bacterium]|nr:T9SS type A sorting domain-containing protein [Bacteroidota bacterium]